jgi:mRNA-degrading endonuclease RelE of RelBE toxin-antitoxin system
MAKYEISFTESALDDLAWIKKREQNQIRDGIKKNLENEPKVETRNRKRLRPNETAEWELRIARFRVF